jgi:sulfite exporter TauE/SafE
MNAMNGVDALAQLVGVGVIWMSVHCAGMCGPIVLGLGVTGPARVLQYQAGRAVTYAVLGAGAGLLGDGLARVSSKAGVVVALVLGVVALARALPPLRWGALPRRAKVVRIGARPSFVDVTLTRVMRMITGAPPFALGAALAFMPCMIAVWALGLAALTASAVWGAVVMVALVAMTTPWLLLAGTLARLSARLSRIMLGVAGAWLILVAAAGAGVVQHMHARVGPFTLMLW